MPHRIGIHARRLVVVLFVALLVALGSGAPAMAHAALVRTDPPASAVLANAPRAVTLTFSEPVRPVVAGIRVIAPDGSRADQGAPTVSGAALRIPLRATERRGTYQVFYRVVSDDGHPEAGGFSFAVGAPSATVPASTGGESAPVDPLVGVLVPVARYLTYAGLVLLVGPILVLLRLWPRRLSRTGPRRLVAAGGVLLAAGTVAGFLLEAPYSTGTGLFGASPADLGAVLGSRVGAAYLVRLVVLAVAWFGVRRVLAGRTTRSDRVLLGLLAVVGILTWPLAGHPGSAPLPGLAVAADAVHLGAMAAWLGGLVMLSGFLLRTGTARELAAVLPVWSRWAAWAVAGLVLTGVGQALIEVGSPGEFVHTRYGQLVLAKTGLVVVVLAVAAYARMQVRRLAVGAVPAAAPVGAAVGVPAGPPPAPAPAEAAGSARLPSRRSLRGAVLVELGVAVVVLGVASVLVQTPPGRTVAQAEQPPTGLPYSATLVSGAYKLQVELDPATVGANELHLYAFTPTGGPVSVLQWRVTAAPPVAGGAPLDVPIQPIAADHAVGDVALPAAGDWRFSFTLRVSDTGAATVTHTVPVR